MNQIIRLMTMVVAASCAASALAAVTPEEAKQLGGPVLTQFGAEKAGNKDGTIPAYTGEAIKVPACYNPKEPGKYCDPWNDKPRVTITAQNMAEYADKLTEGQKELLKRYPNFKMNIYPTRRTQIYPKYVLENTVKNATACHGISGEQQVEGCFGGIPFPIPKSGNQVVWNHLLHYGAFAQTGKIRSLFVDANGNAINQGDSDVFITAPIYDPKITTVLPNNSIYYLVRLDTYGPARKSGEKFVVLDYINNQQRAFQYLPGQRRVKLAPDLAYDTPSVISGGGATMDEQNIFFGQMDRYTFTLVGKTEKFIPANDFALTDYTHCPERVYATKNFPNPDCKRWELRRVWHVQATLKPGFRHILPKRDLYFDEDDAGAGTGDSYDAAGKLYRIDDQFVFPYYDQGYGGNGGISAQTIDLQAGTWAMPSFTGFKGGGYHPVPETQPAAFFSPDGMAGSGIR